MGGRLSVPRGPAGTTEASNPAKVSAGARRSRPPLNARTLIGPLTAVILGCTFYIYSRTAVQAAKVNAQRHRDADGGSISWRNETLRRHGAMDRPEERTIWQQLWESKDEAQERKRKEKERKEGIAMGTEGLKGNRRPEANPVEDGIRKARERSLRERIQVEEEGGK